MNAMAPQNIVWSNVERYLAPLVGNRFDYMTPEENQRVEAIRQRRLLFRGRHREFFINENRTQFPLATLRVNGVERGVYVAYNLLGLISRKGADLLFGEPPSITSTDAAVQAAIESVDRRSHLRRTLFETAVTCSWASEAFLEIRTSDEGAYVASCKVDEVFPVGQVGPDGRYGEYRQYATANAGTPEAPIRLLLITTHRAGTIARELYQLDNAGRKSADKLGLASWPAFQDAAPADVEPTGLERCSIVWIPNELIEGEAVSEYEPDLIELQDMLNSKQSQLARIMAIHANPRMFFPTGSADNDGNVRASDEAFFGDIKEAMPQYVPIAGDPKAAMEDRDFALASLCVRAETTPELLGIKNDAAADSARKMRLAASSPLAKTERRTAYWQPAIQLLMTLAVRVELNRPIDPAAIGVENRAARIEFKQLMVAAGKTVTLSELGGKAGMYGEVPIAEIEQGQTNADILDFDETQGSAANTASMYCVRFGKTTDDEDVQGLIGNSSGDVQYQGQRGTQHYSVLDANLGLGMFHPQSAARLKGILKR